MTARKIIISAFLLIGNLAFAAAPALAAPAIQIIAPQPGQKIESDSLTISWLLTDFTLVDYLKNPTPKAGQGHIHLWLDEASPTAENSIKITSGNTYTFTGIKSGPHTLIAELQNNNHTPLKPPARETITFESITPVYVNPQIPQNDFTLFLILVAIILVGGLWYFLSPESVPHTPSTRKTKKTRRRK